jgi:tRNA threonylcarbamoyladenosine biosynthesis protein TsaB
MLLLSIDTSGSYSCICLIGDNCDIVAENNIVLNENKHFKELNNKQLVPSTLIFKQLDGILSGAGLNLTDIGGIAITLGPGSFTGIRVSLSIAKTLAYSLNLKISGVESLYACAYSFINKSDNFYLTVIKEFIKDKFYFEIYKIENGTIKKFKSLETGNINEITCSIVQLNIKSNFVFLGSYNKCKLNENIQLFNNSGIKVDVFDNLRLAYLSGIIAVNKFADDKKEQSGFQDIAGLSPVYVYSGGAF